MSSSEISTNARSVVLSCDGIWKVFQRGRRVVRALSDVNLEIKCGEFIALTGPSGSGKSTLLDLLGALDFPTKGEICAFGIDLGTLSNEQRNRLRRQKIGLVFQELRLISHLTAVENVMLPRLFDGIPRGTLEEASKKLLSSVKMSARADHFPFELSYGEQQRVAIARAISTSPAILLADEPTANLDDDNAGQVVGIFRGLQAAGTTIVVATHDNRLAGGADRIIKLETGGVIE